MTWTGVHCRLSWAQSHVDAFLTEAIGPLLDAETVAGRITGWYFLRYWETGPHLRIRVRHASPVRVAEIIARLDKLVANADYPVAEPDPAEFHASIGAEPGTWLPHGDIREVPYVPEVLRYGGPDALPAAEELFCRSTEVALAALPALTTQSAKLSAAFGLAIATTTALGLDRPAAAAWLRAHGAGWRQANEPAQPPSIESHETAARILDRHAVTLDHQWSEPLTGAAAHWAEHVRTALTAVGPGRPYVWASQLHMLFNRLGLSAEEERLVCWVVAGSAVAPGGVTPFHADGADAPDRAYQQASKFQPGFPGQLPAQAPPITLPHWLPHADLPAPREVTASLTDALRLRHSSHDWRGTIDARQLASLLWTAHGVLPGEELPRRPYPSAGAAYCARIRVVALDVEGLTPGCYDVDEVNRKLLRTGPAPSIADLDATSMWFGPGASSLAETPALLALYVRNGALRERYGLRALRFAFTEAGHLAQNLGLVAAATGLALGTIGGFYDDVAHDVLGLDGIDDTLVYLLPLGRLG